MPGPAPKNPSTRQRRNRVATAATLQVVKNPKVPTLPTGHAWRPQTRAWWKAIWSSPMSAEYDKSDFNGILRLAYLEDAYWGLVEMGAVTAMLKVMSEIRQQQQSYGLTPMDRRRLQWQIDQGESAEEKTEKRRQARRAARPKPVPAADPRLTLLA